MISDQTQSDKLKWIIFLYIWDQIKDHILEQEY